MIEQLKVEGHVTSKPEIIRREIVKYYKKLFEEDMKQRPTLEGLDLNKLNDEEAS